MQTHNVGFLLYLVLTACALLCCSASESNKINANAENGGSLTFEQQQMTTIGEEPTEEQIRYYIEKALHVNRLRKQLKFQLNVLAHVSARASEDNSVSRAFESVHRNYAELDDLLSDFVPDDKVIHELLLSYKQLKDESASDGRVEMKRSKQYDWFNNKIPVIRNGK